MPNKEKQLFQPTLDGQESWAKLFQSIEAFSPLIEEIYARNHLKSGKITNLTPGTNAVFRVGDTVAKIFAPVESGFNTGNDFFIELAAMRHANKAGVAAPALLCSGSIEDRYLFQYIVMEFIAGREAGHCLPLFTEAQKHAFARKLKTITDGLNVKYDQV